MKSFWGSHKFHAVQQLNVTTVVVTTWLINLTSTPWFEPSNSCSCKHLVRVVYCLGEAGSSFWVKAGVYSSIPELVSPEVRRLTETSSQVWAEKFWRLEKVVQVGEGYLGIISSKGVPLSLGERCGGTLDAICGAAGSDLQKFG